MPGAGWIGLRSDIRAAGGRGAHSARRHAQSRAAPRRSRGVHDDAEVEFAFDMKVRAHRGSRRASPSRIPRSSGRHIRTAGHEVDARLKAGDVRLTMGGEPTFVSIDDMDGDGVEHRAPWAPTKRRFRGDSDPAAAASGSRRAGCCTTARANGIPASSCRAGPSRCTGAATASRCGENDALIDDEHVPAKRRPSSDAERFAADAVPQQLDLPADSAIPAYEDPAHFLLIEQKLPLNLDAATNKLDDPAERARVDQGVRARPRASRRATCCRSRSGNRRNAAAAG